MEELEEGFQYNEDDVRDLERDNKKLEHEVYDLKKQLLYMETYSRRENLQFFGVPENTECTTEEGAQQGVAFENTREVMYKFLEEKLKIERPREKIELQRIHRLGRPNSLKLRPIIARFLRYSDRELVMDSARRHLKGHQDLHVFEDITKALYELRQQQMKTFKEAREREREDTRRILAKQTQTNFLSTANMLLQISLCSNSEWICISFCELLNFYYFTAVKIFDTINKELE